MSSSLGGLSSAASGSSVFNNPQLLGALLPNYNIASLDQAMQAELNVDAIPLSQMSQQVGTLSTQLSAWQTLQSDLGSLQSDAQSLGGTSLYQGISASSTNTSAVTANASGSGVAGTYQVAVSSLMQSEIDNSAAQASDSTALNLSGTFQVNGQTISVSTSDTLQSLATSINDAGAGVTATVLPSGGSKYVLNIASTTGAAITWSDPNGILQGLGVLNFSGAPANQIQQAAAASYTINGVSETSTTNSDATSIPGVTLNFLSATPSGQPAYVTVTQDQGAIVGAFQKLASDYNNLLGDLNKFGGKGGVLEGDAGLLGISSTIQQTLTEVNGALPSGYQSLAQLGVTISAPVGQPDQLSMSVNTATLQAALDGNAADVALLLNGATSGIATQLIQQLNTMVGTTGSVGGTVSNLQSQISDLNSQINDPNSAINQRITLQQQSLENEFQNMLSALMGSTMQGQQITGFLQAQYGAMYANQSGGSGIA